MWKPLALVAICCVVVGSQIAQADEGQSTTPPVSTSSCTPIKKVYSEKHWQEAKPQRGKNVCPARSRSGARNTVEHWKLYREYREITPYRCQSGSEGTYAIPCSIIACESGFDWMAANPSGAVGVYQLLGWGAPYPARTFRQRLENHEIAAGLSLSNWVCA